MKKERISLGFRNKKMSIECIRCNSLKKVTGLMFTRRKNAGVLLFEFKKPTRTPIHSLFVFFPFIAVWLDNKNQVLETRIVKPFELYILPKQEFSGLVEIPFNEKNKRIINLLSS